MPAANATTPEDCTTTGSQSTTGDPLCCPAGIRKANAPGDAIMQALADAAGISVIAAVNAQTADANFRFEGPVRYYYPERYYHRPHIPSSFA
jgi:hypothetical protein